jgi:hypothetical protein
MRPCWPYSDAVSYLFNWGDLSTTAFNGAAHSWTTSNHTWATPGTKTITLTALNDMHGRTFNNMTTLRKIQLWTPWLNRDNHFGDGDYELLSAFVANGQSCSNPTAIECKTLAGVPWNLTGQVYSCTPSTGGVCVNDSQSPPGSCQDYQVRFLCP